MKNKETILMKMGLLLLAVFLTVFTTKAQVGALIWEENFNAIDPAIWSYDVGDGCAIGLCGWGNQELEYYRSENSRIEAVPGESGNNALVIEAKREAFGGKTFTSSRMKSTEGVAVQYGMIETRLQVPNLQTGLWPAAWMLGTTTASWPAKGEIDIMEMGHSTAEKTRQGYPSTPANNFAGSNLIFYSSGACSDANASCAASIAYDVNYDKPYIAATPLNGRFVKYRLYWTSTEMRFTIIDNNVETDLYESPFLISAESQEFQAPFYFLLNLAVGGGFTDALTDAQVTAPLPGKMLVDYIRVYKYNNQGGVIIGSTAIKESGTFGLFTDNTPTTNKLEAGVTSDIYAWNNFAAGTTTAYEGSNVIAWQTTDAAAWFGGGIATRQARDMSSFSGGNLKFRIKIPANVTFKVGITDNYTNQFYVNFPANTTTYGLVRNGEWAQATIPISALTGGIIALQSMQYLFAIVSVDGAIPTTTFQIGLDDIYWEGGGGVVTVPVTGVTMSPTTASIAVGATQLLTPTIAPANATNKSVTYSSSNSAVATVNSSGLITAVAAGSATITVTTADQAKTATCAVTVTSATVIVTGVTLSPTTATLSVGGTQQLAATVAPTNATNKAVTYTTSNSAVANVSASGLVTAVAAGTATITVKTTDQAKTATCAITVTTATVPVTGVTLSPTTASIAVGGTQQLTATIAPTNATNKAVNYTTSNSAIATVNAGGLITAVAAGTATITVTTADQAKTATCAVTVTASTLTDITNLGGTITTQYTGSPTNEGIAKLIDNSSSTKFLTFYASAWVQYQSPSAYIVTSYSMTSANDAAERDPLTWTLQGSTNGTTWVTINSQTAQDFATRLLKRTFSFTNTTSYAYYRLNMTNNSGTILQLAELELFGVPGTTTIPVTGVTMSPTTASISVAGTQQLTATVAPTNATNKTVTFTTSNSAIASVSASGLVTGVAAGTATITVTTQDGAKTATCAVTVTATNIPVTGVTMSPTTASILVAGTQQLTATVAPANATNKAVTWTTSNSAVATVNASGLVTGVAAGSATITVTTTVGSYKATCAVTVTPSSVFTTKIEAESYTSMLGVQTEATTDAGAGLNVGWIEAGDWMAYPAVTIPAAGTYTIEYRIASMSGGGNIQFELAGGSPIYGTLAVPSTGGWQTWSTIKHTVTLSAGSQSFAILALAGGWNINWFAITQGVKSATEQSNFVSKTTEIELYPNPASDFLSIVHPATTSELNVRVYSLTGSLIFESNMANETALDISNLNSGTYIVRVSTDTDVQNKIFIKK